MRNVTGKVAEKIRTHALCSILPTTPQNYAIYEIMQKNNARLNRLQMKIQCMNIACWIPKATNTHSEYVILIVFPCNNCCMNVPQYYVIGTLPILFNIAFYTL
jgi:hypothetical protein